MIRRKAHPEIRRIERQRYHAKYPWVKAYGAILARCNNPKHQYAQLGIKNYLTREDLKVLWFRDKAHDMRQPSIDRIDPKGDYTFKNCRYLELELNRKTQTTKTHCPKGHEYTPDNIRRENKTGRKHCRQCDNIRPSRRINNP
jgi:hypothetical protein